MAKNLLRETSAIWSLFPVALFDMRALTALLKHSTPLESGYNAAVDQLRQADPNGVLDDGSNDVVFKYICDLSEFGGDGDVGEAMSMFVWPRNGTSDMVSLVSSLSCDWQELARLFHQFKGLCMRIKGWYAASDDFFRIFNVGDAKILRMFAYRWQMIIVVKNVGDSTSQYRSSQLPGLPARL